MLIPIGITKFILCSYYTNLNSGQHIYYFWTHTHAYIRTENLQYFYLHRHSKGCSELRTHTNIHTYSLTTLNISDNSNLRGKKKFRENSALDNSKCYCTLLILLVSSFLTPTIFYIMFRGKFRNKNLIKNNLSEVHHFFWLYFFFFLISSWIQEVHCFFSLSEYL